MLKKSIMTLMALLVAGLTIISEDAQARRCPDGYEDNGTNQCVLKPVDMDEDGPDAPDVDQVEIEAPDNED